MSGLSQKPEPITQGTRETPKKIHSIPHEFAYFKSLVIGNGKDVFGHSSEELAHRDELRRADYRLLMSHLEMYKETVSDDYPDYADFAFLQEYVQRLYQALYSEAPLASVFENQDVQDRFFSGMERYLFEGFARKHLELTEQYRRPTPEQKPILTADEIDGLLGTFDAQGNRVK
ncbi:MAG: hypothetical protein PHQ95_00805 [Candidatus Gracilibacteria bacterium]|nr:hypothetical protein [Candidatus Gracilibacteria bacterium]